MNPLTTEPEKEEDFKDEVAFCVDYVARYHRNNGQTKVLNRLHSINWNTNSKIKKHFGTKYDNTFVIFWGTKNIIKKLNLWTVSFKCWERLQNITCPGNFLCVTTDQLIILL